MSTAANHQREQLEIGLPRKQLFTRMIRIETNQLIISINVIAEDWLRTIAWMAKEGKGFNFSLAYLIQIWLSDWFKIA